MIHFFGDLSTKVFAVQTNHTLSKKDIEKLDWLFGNQPYLNVASIDAFFVGPRAAMITPWSTNATEITQNMGITGIIRIEEFNSVDEDNIDFDPMLAQKYKGLNQEIYTIDVEPHPILEFDNISKYNKEEGLALCQDEVEYLEGLSKKI